MTLVEFLTARLDEDERWATDAGEQAVWLAEKLLMHEGFGYTVSMPLSEARAAWMPTAQEILREMADPFESWPAHAGRVLREVEAKRRIIKALLDSQADSKRGVDETFYDAGWDAALHSALSCLAEAYSDHPDFQEEWAV